MPVTGELFSSLPGWVGSYGGGDASHRVRDAGESLLIPVRLGAEEIAREWEPVGEDDSALACCCLPEHEPPADASEEQGGA